MKKSFQKNNKKCNSLEDKKMLKVNLITIYITHKILVLLKIT